MVGSETKKMFATDDDCKSEISTRAQRQLDTGLTR